MSDLINNTLAFNIANILNQNQLNLAENLLQLSTGLRINTPAEDVAGNAVANQLQNNINVLNQGTLNAQDLISAVQTAQGALGQINNILQQLNTLAAEATNGILGPQDRQDIQGEVNQLVHQINSIAQEANFAGVPLLQGNFAGAQQAVPSTIQVTSNALLGPQGEPLVGSITVNPAALNPAAGQTEFLNEAFQVQIAPNGASAVSVLVTASGNPGVIVASLGVNLTAPPTAPVPITIPSSAPGGATFVANLDFQGLAPSNIPQIAGESAFIATTAFQPAVTANNALAVQVGPSVGNVAEAGIPSNLASNLLQSQNLNIGTRLQAEGALVQIQQAINFVSSNQAVLGSLQNQTQALIQNNSVLQENLLASQTRIQGLNVAQATTDFTKNEILTQTAASMLAQANLLPQGILSLFS